MKKKNGFTLIELIAVLVILAILALLVTPLVMNIIRKARISADKRSVDAYGRSIELAIATYLLDNGTFPTDVSQLTIEYTGDEVVCSTVQLNTDSSVYLAECTVGGRSVKHYSYKTDSSCETTKGKEYSVGNPVVYNNEVYYVIKDSALSDESVTLLKAEPLSVDEVASYGDGHVNMYAESTSEYYQRPFKIRNTNFGGMAYYSSPTCGYNGSSWVSSGCINDYNQSEIKYVVDAWATDKIGISNLIEDSFGYKTRLLTKDELINNLGLEISQEDATGVKYARSNYTPSWVFGLNWSYWTMTPEMDGNNAVWIVSPSTGVGPDDYSGYVTVRGVTQFNCYDFYGAGVRPVITIKKSALN